MSRPTRSGGPGKRPLPTVVRDKRRIDPVTLQLRGPDSTPQRAETGAQARAQVQAQGAPATGPEAQLAERTADLQRLKAEYDNYRKRVRRDRLAIREVAVANVLGGLLPVLDAIDQAREHGDPGLALDPGLRAVADVLETQLAALGLQEVGAAGEPFDPTHHEAVTHEVSDEVDRPTCTTVLRPGYRVGRHLLRPAQVAVSEPPDRAGTDAPE